jgi:uncharacterized protein YycO
MMQIKKALIKFFADIRLYRGGFILFGDSHYKMKGENVRRVLDVLREGDVLLRRYDHYLGGMLTPGFWTHAGLYVGQNNVIHMLADGITKDDILTFCRTDHVAVLRAVGDDYDKYYAVKKAKMLYDADIEYDYDFTSENQDLYCTELVWMCYGEHPSIIFDKYILPDDLLCDLFRVIVKEPHVKPKT